MAWRSLFAFSNPNGRVGSTYTADNNSSLNFSKIHPFNFIPRNLATFPSLPKGIYSISGGIPISIVGESPPTSFPIHHWIIGAGTVSLSTDLTTYSLIPFPTNLVDSIINIGSGPYQ